ncbi:MAG: hypothetical protein K6U87_10780 [Firmicutes bacterium]|nr:hypothetical protein [Bacillota bacterium]
MGLNPKFRTQYIVLGLTAIVIMAYLSFIARYGVNVPFWDEWDQVPIVNAALHGHLNFSQLWDQHNENRMFLPNLLVVLVALMTHWNLKIEMWFSALLSIASFAVFMRMVKWKTLPFLLPISALIWFSLAQYENTLWGFQLAWYLVLFCFLLCITFLYRESYHSFVISTIFAILASISSFQGLLTWPIGLLILLISPSPSRSKILSWTAAGLGTIILYFTGFTFRATVEPWLSYSLSHPFVSLVYFFTVLGSVTSVGASNPTDLLLCEMVGVSVFTLSVYFLSHWWSTKPEYRFRTSPVVVPILFGLLFDISLVVGRSGFGIPQATSSRYTLYNLVLLTALSWAVLLQQSLKPTLYQLRKEWGTGALAVILVISLASSTLRGLAAGGNLLAARLMATDVLANFKDATDNLITSTIFPSVPMFKVYAEEVMKDRLSVFNSSSAIVYRRLGILPEDHFSKLLPIPLNLQLAITVNDNVRLAWAALSTVYDSRPDLKQAFPLHEPQFAYSLLHWAITSGTTSVSTRKVLAPLAPQYISMFRLLGGSPIPNR